MRILSLSDCFPYLPNRQFLWGLLIWFSFISSDKNYIIKSFSLNKTLNLTIICRQSLWSNPYIRSRLLEGTPSCHSTKELIYNKQIDVCNKKILIAQKDFVIIVWSPTKCNLTPPLSSVWWTQIQLLTCIDFHFVKKIK